VMRTYPALRVVVGRIDRGRLAAAGACIALLLSGGVAAASPPPPPDWRPSPPPPVVVYGPVSPAVVYAEPVVLAPPSPPPRPLPTALRVIYAPFYVAALTLRYGLYYGIVVPLEVFGRTLAYGFEGGVEDPDADREGQ
jgi:hypothetical protein